MVQSDAGPARDSFGAALRRMRTERGLSLAGLARLVHYSRGYLSKVETGTSTPNAALARRCDEALGAGGELARLLPPPARRPPPVPDRPPASRRPFDLPPAPAHFLGRTAEEAALADLVRARSGAGPGFVPQVVVHGMAGVGKTALAVQVAHRIAGDFPDGCLFVDLHSYGPDGVAALSAGDALEVLLRRLGVPAEAVPERADDRAALFRGTVHGLRVLVVVDNARRAEQVRPLVPGSSSCAVVATSRSRLAALDDAVPLRLGPLPQDDAAALFAAVARLDRDRLGSGSARQLSRIVGSCGGLPLAVRIAAASQRGGDDPDELADLAGRLADGRRRLAELDDGERSARAALAASCADLPPARRELLALVALHPGHDLSVPAAAWLSGTDQDRCRPELRRLVDDSLLSPAGGDRYVLHELVRTFAVQSLAQEVPEAARTAARRRLVTGYLASVAAADRVLTPHRFRPELDPHAGPPPLSFPDAEAAAAWCDAERDNLVAACRLAALEGWSAACWQLAFVLRGYLFLAKAWDAWIETHRVALAAARAAGDEWGEAVTRGNLGLALIERGHVRSAQEHYARSLALFRRIGDPVGEATVLGHQAWAAYCLRDYETCARLAGTALAVYEREGIRRNQAITLRTLALAESRLGRAADAERHLREALQVFEELDLRLDAAMACNGLGQVLADRGDGVASRRWYARAVQVGEACGSRFEQARGYEGLATAAAATGRWRAARRFAERSLHRYDALNAPDADRVRAAFGLGGSASRAAPPDDRADHRDRQAQ